MDNGNSIVSRIALTTTTTNTTTTTTTTTSSTTNATCPLENVSTTFQSLDTVRALHHTVVSLRSALEEAKFEIQRLRSQITTEADIKEGAKLKPNHQHKTIRFQTDNNKNNYKLNNHNHNNNNNNNNELPSVSDDQQHQFKQCSKKILIGQDNQKPTTHIDIPELNQISSTPRNISINKSTSTSSSSAQNSYRITTSARKSPSQYSNIPEISIKTTPRQYCNSEFDCDKNMASKIDLKIKVTSNINVGDNNSNNNSSSTEPTSTTNDSDNQHKIDGNFQFSTEDNLSVRKSKDGNYIVNKSSKENLNILDDDDDDDDENTPSEGDNSVFELQSSNVHDEKSTAATKNSKEECDDIELVFSSDGQHHRDPIQEEMISLTEFDPWQAAGSSGTPVLVKFSSLQSEQNSMINEIDLNPINKLPTSSTCDTFIRNLSQDKSLESTDSFDNQLIMINNQKSLSLDKDNSCLDQTDNNNKYISRDESLDFFDNNNDGSMGRKWTNYNVLVETDISKCGIAEETPFELYHRRNTCPNPPAYRPILPRDMHTTTRHIPSRLASKYCRRIQYNPACNASSHYGANNIAGLNNKGPKRSSSAQTEISALPEYWKSECHLAGNRYFIGGPCTLPSKFVPMTSKKGCQKHNVGISTERTQEARRVLLSDINFTSMVPELSRSDDDINKQHHHMESQQSSGYYKGNLLKTPDYVLKGMTPSVSMTSPGLSQWTVNENSFGTQTIQTGDSWGVKRGDSLDSCRSYSTGSRLSDLNRHQRSRSVPSVRCAICKQARVGPTGQTGIRISESMHYTPRVTFQEPASKIRGSLPDLRQDCMCSRRFTGRTIFTIHGDSSGSTESLLDEADAFVRKSFDGTNFKENCHGKRPNLRRMSENDIQKDYIPSKQSLPFLPKTPKCLKTGHLAKVITKSGRVVVGRVRFVGPIMIKSKILTTNTDMNTEGCSGNGKVLDDLYVGIQLQSKCGDCDGTFDGRKFFDCEPLQGLFVPFKKVIMAWTG